MKRRFGLPLVVGLAAAMALLLPGTATAVGSDPKPIPGGIQIPDGPLIHVFAPGPVDLGFHYLDVVLPEFVENLADSSLEPQARDRAANRRFGLVQAATELAS